MSLHRQNADLSDLRTTRLPWRASDLIAVIGVIILIVGAYCVAQASDDRAERQQSALIAIERQRAPIPADIQAAYELGLSDAFAAMRSAPVDEELAQVCAAVDQTLIGCSVHQARRSRP